MLAALAVAALLLSQHLARPATAQGSLQKTEALANLSSDLREQLRAAAGGTVSIILQLSAQPSSHLVSLIRFYSLRINGVYDRLGAVALELPAWVVQLISTFPEIAYISPDRAVNTLGHVVTTAGLGEARAQLGEAGLRLDGSGVGVAVIDSGIYNGHVMFGNKKGGVRVVVNRDFVCTDCRAPDTQDSYGHGSHVAGLTAGNGEILSGAFEGVAPRANLFNLRVLDENGAGTVSSVLKALDWVLTNHATYNIRVVNMSLGTPAVDSYKVDPLCRAVRLAKLPKSDLPAGTAVATARSSATTSRAATTRRWRSPSSAAGTGSNR